MGDEAFFTGYREVASSAVDEERYKLIDIKLIFRYIQFSPAEPLSILC